jgi:hypothetical protein
MPTPLDFPARGKILRAAENNILVFQPTGSTYELHLLVKDAGALAPGPATVSVIIRAPGRKLWTMSSGGNFITPIFGPPKVIQGRVVYHDDRTAVVHAAVPVLIDLPPDPVAYDFVNGPLTVGNMVNITLLPGATIELAPTPATVR